jgi:hypothetical protein
VPEEACYDQANMVAHLTQLFLKLDVLRVGAKIRYLAPDYIDECTSYSQHLTLPEQHCTAK